MKPVSVTSDDMGIEACFERSMLSDLGKNEEHDDPALSEENDPCVDERDDGTLECSDTLGSNRHNNDHSLRDNEEEGSPREETSTRRDEPDPTPPALSGSQSNENFIEAEFEMVLENPENRPEQEKPEAAAGKLENSSDAPEVSTSEEEEEKVVVWCADTISQSTESESERMYPIEEEPADTLERESPNDSMEGSTNRTLSLSNNLATELTNASSEGSMLDNSVEWQSDEDRIGNMGSKEQVDTKSEEETTVPSLSTLINQRQWHRVIERVGEFSSLTDVSIEDQVSFLGRDSLGDSFFHEICKNQPTVEVIRLWLERNKDDVKRHGIGGHLPLHYACAFGASVDVIEVLIEAYPDSLITPDDHDNMLPLHFACRQGATIEVLEVLLEAHPEATFAEDNHGLTPMDCAMSLQDQTIRDQVVKCIQNSLKRNITTLSSLLADTKATLREEQERVQNFSRKARLEKEAKEKKAREDHSLLEYTLSRVAVLEKSENEKKSTIENMKQKTQTLESQLAETQLQLTAEKNRLYIEKTRDLESVLKIEQCKISALEQSLVAKQEMLDNEKERTKDAEQRFSEMRILLQNERLKTKHLGESLNVEQAKLKRLEEEKATKVAGGIPKLHDAPTSSDIDEETTRRIELDRSETESKLEANREAIRALEISNAKKQELLDVQQEKVELLERFRREKESLLQKSQETMKVLEESIERKLSLQKAEEEKIRQLDNLRHKKRQMIESEEEQVRKLDYLLGRKQALLELEQMKEKTLQQTIAQKQALLESEGSKMRELEAIYAQKEALFVSEQNLVKALQASKKEKEGLFRTERELVNKLQHVLSEKETLLKKKQRIQDDIAKCVRAGEDMLSEEKKLLEATEKARAEKEELLFETDEAVKAIEARASKASSLMEKEQRITESLEKFQERRQMIAGQSKLYCFVDTTLSISHLVKEALLAKKYEQRLIEEQKPKRGVVIKKNNSPSESLLRKAFSVKGKRYLTHVAGYFGLSPTWRKYAR